MFTKKQTSTIQKPLKTLRMLQQQRNLSLNQNSLPSIQPPSHHIAYESESNLFDVVSFESSNRFDFAFDISLDD